MAQIQQQCPKCGTWQNIKTRTCINKACGFALSKRPGRQLRIDYRDGGQRRREHIGPSKAAAEQRLREVETALAEGRHIKKSKDARTRFRDLAAWYKQLSEVRAKRSYKRDEHSLNRLLPYFADRLLKDITPGTVEAYRQKRLSEPSGRLSRKVMDDIMARLKEDLAKALKDPDVNRYLTKPATVNREIALFKTIFNKAIKDDRAERNPAQGVKLLKENNERDRVLSQDEYARLLAHLPPHVKPIVKLAYLSGMRQGEILGLTWGQVDLKEGFIKLAPEHCKSNEGRLVPLTSELVGMLRDMQADLGGFPMPGVKVFTYAGRSVGSIKRAFESAVKKAGVEDFTFHDLRHTAINNWRLQGHDYFRIMAASGHKTMHVFKRYSTVSREELKALVRV